MNKIVFIENQFNEKIVVTLPELSRLLNLSIRTIQRITRGWDTIRSYDHNGRYFSLERLAEFNSYGIWEYNDIHFSKFGNLKNTLIAIINNSIQGMDASQIRDVLGVDTRSFLYQYKDVSGIRREKLGSIYVYFSGDPGKFPEQLSRRKLNMEALAHPPLKGPTAINVLVAALKHPSFTADQLSKHLHKLGTRVKPKAIQDFFTFYGIEKKNAGFKIACLLRQIHDDTVDDISLTNVFEHPPVIRFKTTKRLCPNCKVKLKVHHTDTRKIYSLHIGAFSAHRTFMYCPVCKKIHPPEEPEEMVPQFSNVGYDVIVFIGRLIFQKHHTIKETLAVLERRNIYISSSEVAYLAQKFIIYLSIIHYEAGLKLKMQIHNNGGYILHIDGTSEGASPHLISAIDEISNFILANVKVPGESKEQVVPFLKEIKKQYGDPLAVTSDMGRAFLSAISEVFPDRPNYICHFHFLRDTGKDLLEKQYSTIRNKLKKYGITSQLRYRLRYYFENKGENINVCQINQVTETTKQIFITENRIIKQVCYILILWALDGKNHGNGFGFPFDRPHAEFYKRLCLLFEKLNGFQARCKVNKSISKIIGKLIGDLMPLVNDTELKEAFKILSEKEKVFDKLREALFIALPTTANGLNDDGEKVEIATIESKVKDFKQWLPDQKYYRKNPDYQKLIAQIDKYWDKLFSDPIIISSAEGDSLILPQRTNNILEQFFRGIRRAHRRRTGNNSMCKKLQSMFADTPLVKNLDNPDYMKILLGETKSLEEKFADIDHKKIIAKMADAGKAESKIPRRIKKLIRELEIVCSGNNVG